MSSFKESRSYILSKLEMDSKRFDELNIEIPYNEIFPVIEDKEAYFKDSFNKIGGSLFEVKTLDECLKEINNIILERGFKNTVCFESEFEQILEKNIIFNEKDIQEVGEIEVSITTCEALISRTGSILISSNSNAGRKYNIIPDTHIVVAYKNQILLDIIDGFNFLENKYGNNRPSMVSLVSGPSRTADIEKTLVMGAHGPKEILLFLIN
jgi:L-lactate dehydrogenase complex protein LldG